jgi:hypothetical protein
MDLKYGRVNDYDMACLELGAQVPARLACKDAGLTGVRWQTACLPA